jgi:flagellar hook-associated protein 1 FlgK
MTQISTFFGLQQTLRGILAHQRAIETTGQNITNANTEGYSRQQINLSAATPYSVEAGLLVDGGGAQLGGGVDIMSFQRVRDSFLDLQYRAQNLRQGGYDASTSALEQVEQGFSEPSDNGISKLLGNYWSAWQNVANNPENDATRTALVAQGKTLAGAINELQNRITDIAAQTTQQYTGLTNATGDVQGYANELGKLNNAIKDAVAGGDAPNDLYDRRDLLLDKLSGLAQVSSTDNGDGTITVSFGDATNPLVQSNGTVNWPQALTNPGGKLGALIDLTKAGGSLDGYKADLNAFAKSLADSVNTLHNPGGTGSDFFTYTAGNEAASLAVGVTAAQVKFSSGTASGGNDIATAIGNLRNGTADQSYQSLVAKIGSDVKNTQRLADNAKVLTDSINDRRQSVSGVSMDEEMTNLIKFQRGYQGSARAMNAVDEMLDQLINRTGRVGL